MDSWPLVARDLELGRAGAALFGEARSSVVLTGAAGAGKSRLAAALAERAVAAGEVVLRAVASESAATIPFGALAPLLPRVGAERDPLVLLQGVQAELRDRALGGRFVLWVDDAQHLDAGSATLVQQLVSSGTCPLVATVRSGTLVPDALTDLWRNGDAELIEVGPLDQEAVRTVLEAALGGDVARSTELRLWQRSKGNPLYLRELVDAALLDGVLDRSTGVWTLRGRGATSRRLGEMVGARLGRLDAASLSAVELLALADVLSPTTLGALVPGLDLEALEERGVVAVTSAGQRTEVRLAHPLYGETVRASIPVTRRRRHHAALAEWVTASGSRRREDVLRTATWQLDGDRAPTADLLAVAADQAEHRFDLALARRLAQAAVDAGAGVAAWLTLGEVAFRDGRPDEALDLLAAAAGRATTDDEAVAVADARAHVLSVLGRSAEAWQVMRELRDAVGPQARDRIDARSAVLMIFAGRAPEALDAVAHLSAAHGGTEGLSRVLRIRADYVVTLALAVSGRAAEADARAEAAYAFLQDQVQGSGPPEQAFIGRCLAFLLVGRLAEAAADAERLEAALLAAGDKEGEATGALLHGRVALAAGDTESGLAHLRRAAAANRDLGDLTGLRWSLAGLALGHGLRGEAVEAAVAKQEVEALVVEPYGLFEPDLVQRGLAWADVANGGFDAARDRLALAAATAADLGQPAVELLVRHDLLRLGDARQVPRLVELAGVAEGPFPAAVAVHAAAVRSGVGADLADAVDALEAGGSLIEAAEVAAAAAASFHEEGLARRVTALRLRAEQLAARCPGARTPGLVRAGTHQVVLTAREREIADLAARRLAAADIAERLFLSRRTVENHLQRIYAKLGISSRAELADRLQP